VLRRESVKLRGGRSRWGGVVMKSWQIGDRRLEIGAGRSGTREAFLVISYLLTVVMQRIGVGSHFLQTRRREAGVIDSLLIANRRRVWACKFASNLVI
jgi:hypothetical protein